MVVMMMNRLNNNSKEMEQHLGCGGGSASSTTSEGNSASSTSPDSPPNTLKFGQKIYFQHVGPGAQPKSPSGSSSSSPPVAGAPAPAKKGRGGRIPRCQVEGCEADLSDVKAYYGRHKVCATHSKSPTVVVAGLEQRFCQQCSRFHRLSEFDQGKRSCRRRLAGHNERRRKPPPGSLLSTRYGSLSSSLFASALTENNSRSGSFLVDFSSYPNLTERSWPNTRTSEGGWDNHSTGSGKFPQSPWPSGSGNSTPELVLQGSAARATSYAGPGIPSGNCFTGVSNSSGALSLLSNESWGSRNQPSSLGINSLVNTDGGHTFQPSGSHVAPINHFSGPQWGFKGNEGSSSSHNMPPDLGLGQIPRHSVNQYSELGMAPQSGRHYMELEHSKGYDSSVQNVHWTL